MSLTNPAKLVRFWPPLISRQRHVHVQEPVRSDSLIANVRLSPRCYTHVRARKTILLTPDRREGQVAKSGCADPYNHDLHAHRERNLSAVRLRHSHHGWSESLHVLLVLQSRLDRRLGTIELGTGNPN